jgi:hypothetical protein
MASCPTLPKSTLESTTEFFLFWRESTVSLNTPKKNSEFEFFKFEIWLNLVLCSKKDTSPKMWSWLHYQQTNCMPATSVCCFLYQVHTSRKVGSITKKKSRIAKGSYYLSSKFQLLFWTSTPHGKYQITVWHTLQVMRLFGITGSCFQSTTCQRFLITSLQISAAFSFNK